MAWSGREHAPSQLTGKVAIVTGSTRGIGKAIALGFAREGAKVVVCGRSSDSGDAPLTVETTAREVRELGAEVLAVACDVTRSEEVGALVEQTILQWGRVDVLVNNAGIKWSGGLLDTPLEKWDEIVRTNLDGVYLCTMAVLSHMRRQRSGSIVTISSGRAQSEDGGSTAYAATKAAVNRLMIKLAAELKGDGIAVNALDPGATMTEVGMARTDRARPDWPFAEEKKIIPACVYLACQTADGITGRVLDQDDYGVSWP